MKIIERSIRGVYEIQLEPKKDHRGYFMRVYDDNIFKEHGIHREWVNENHSLSIKKGTVRGLHFQFMPHIETKLVRVISGIIFDVYVDLRKGSETFGKWDSIILSEENKKMLLIPRGFAHGICTMSDDCIMLYKVDNYYAAGHEGAIKWNDPDLGIEWPLEGDPILSDKDSKAGSFSEFLHKYDRLEVQ